jgi:hypothetical protein
MLSPEKWFLGGVPEAGGILTERLIKSSSYLLRQLMPDAL